MRDSGYWRLLDRAYLNEVLELILTNAKANGWPLSAVPEAACETELGDYPPTVVRHSLRLFSDAPAPGLYERERARALQRR